MFVSKAMRSGIVQAWDLTTSALGKPRRAEAPIPLDRKLTCVLPYLLGAVSIVAPILAMVYLAGLQTLRDEKRLATSIAQQVLQRAETVNTQLVALFTALEAAHDPDPCSDANIERMRHWGMVSSQMQGVGLIVNDRLICSSFGRHEGGIALGAADYVSDSGAEWRISVELPFAAPYKFLVISHKGSGYAGIVHPDLPIDVPSAIPDIALGVYEITGATLITSRGHVDHAWMGRLGGQSHKAWGEEGYVVAAQRSKTSDYVGYAAIPMAYSKQQQERIALIMVPFSLAAGLGLAFIIFRETRRRLSLPALLKAALKRGELHLVYQPVVDLGSERWVGAEALLRWCRPDGTSISPAVFIPMAEQFGLARKVTATVISLCVRDMSEIARRFPDFHVGVNFSASDFKDESAIGELTDTLRAAGVPSRAIMVEATEHVFMDIDMARRNVNSLREQGIRVAIDDFGTGYSSLSYLTTLQVDYLKIDKSFVDTIGTDAATSNVVSHIIEMAKSLNLKIIAEGVETRQQADYLRDHGVQYAQGWLFSKPMGVDDLEARLS